MDINDLFSVLQLDILAFIRARGGASVVDILRSCPAPAPTPELAESAKDCAIRGLILSGNLVGPDPDGKYQLAPDAETMFNQIDLIKNADRDWPLAEIAPIAEKLLSDLRSMATGRAELAGSIRRRKATCGDVEVCALTNDARLRDALKSMAAVVIKSGEKYIHVVMETAAGPVKVDLFETARNEQWGMLFFIRTGSADFVKRALGYWKKISDGGYCQENCLYRPDKTLVQTFDETAVFAALKCSFVPPEKRIAREGA